MTRQPVVPSVSRITITLAACIILIAGIRAAAEILVPFLLSVFAAAITSPVLFWLYKKGIPKALSLLLVIIGIIGIGVAMVMLISTSLADFSSSMPGYRLRLEEESARFIQWLNSLGVSLPEQVIRESFDPGSIMQFVAKLFSGLSTMLTNSFFILLTTIFILTEATSFPVKLRSILPDPETSLENFKDLLEDVKRYVAMKSVFSVMTGLIIFLWLKIIGVDYALLWGLLAFIFNYVPNIGSIIAAIPAVLLALVQSGISLALLSASGYLVVNIVIGSIVEPKFMGRGLGLSTLVVFLSLVFWGWVLGPVGMLLSIPLTMLVKMILESKPDIHWIGVLLGPEREALPAVIPADKQDNKK